MQILRKIKTKNQESVNNLWRILGTKPDLLVDFWDHIFKSVFPKQLFLFSILHSKLSRNMCKLCHKVRNGQNLPYESPNFRNHFFLSNFTDSLVHFSTSLETTLPKQFFFSTLRSRMSKNMCICFHKLCNAKTGVSPTFTWSNEALFIGFKFLRKCCLALHMRSHANVTLQLSVTGWGEGGLGHFWTMSQRKSLFLKQWLPK